MPRFFLYFFLCCCLTSGLSGMGTSALAANGELSSCLDPSTVLEAGGDVSNQELKAALSACARLKQSSPDHHTLMRIDHAVETIDDEMRRRQTAGH
jgi:hypothetical protein